MHSLLNAIAGILFASSALAQSSPASQVFAIPQQGVTFLTGDTWQQGRQQMRLYGVQSCLRGTSFTNTAGVAQDCGEASLAFLAALVRDARPDCTAVAQIAPTGGQPGNILVICSAHVGSSTVDLGTLMVTSGFAFAAFTNDAKPVYMPYLVAELSAKKAKAGLWAFADMPHPNSILFQAVRASKQAP